MIHIYIYNVSCTKVNPLSLSLSPSKKVSERIEKSRGIVLKPGGLLLRVINGVAGRKDPRSNVPVAPYLSRALRESRLRLAVTVVRARRVIDSSWGQPLGPETRITMILGRTTEPPNLARNVLELDSSNANRFVSI